jgi:predicted nucleic acid-binding Zn ribbon protein
MDSQGPERLSEILSRLFTARGWGRQQERLRLEQAWAESAGADYISITRVAGFRRRVLEIEVKGAIPLQELNQFHKRKILERLRKALAGVTIADLKFRAATW